MPRPRILFSRENEEYTRSRTQRYNNIIVIISRLSIVGIPLGVRGRGWGEMVRLGWCGGARVFSRESTIDVFHHPAQGAYLRHGDDIITASGDTPA